MLNKSKLVHLLMYLYWISHWILRRMSNVLDKSCVENQNTHFMPNSFSSKIVPLWYNVEKCGGARRAKNDVTIWRIRVEFRVSKALACKRPHILTSARAHARTHTHIIICNSYCFSTATIIRECASVWRYTYFASLVQDRLIHYIWDCSFQKNKQGKEWKQSPKI
jgi:hypothetical protein